MTEDEARQALDKAERERAELSADVERLSKEAEQTRSLLQQTIERLAETEKQLVEVRQIASDAADAAELADSDDGGGGSDAVGSSSDGDNLFPENMLPGPIEADSEEPYAYKVMEENGDVYCYLPMKESEEKEGEEGEGGYHEYTGGGDEGGGDEGEDSVTEFCGGAFGGPHIGSSEEPTCEADSPPHASKGYEYGSGVDAKEAGLPKEKDFKELLGDSSWAHYGWHKVGSLKMPTEQEPGPDEKVVVATFKVPLDPPEDEREGAEVEGPSLSSIELMEIDDWKSACKYSWKEFDDPSGESVERKIPIALIANGIVTQLCVGVPFVDRGGNGDGGDQTKVDTRDMPEGECQKSVDFYHTFEPDEEIEEPDGQGGTRKKWKAKDQSSSVGGATVYTYDRSEAAEHEEIAPGRIVQLYDFTSPSISVTEMPVPTPEVDSSGSVDGPVFLIRDEGGTGGVCPTLKYTQLKLKDDRCPPPEVWLTCGTSGSVTLHVKSYDRGAGTSGPCSGNESTYTFTPTSVDAPDCSGIRACIDDPVDVVTNVSICGTSLYVERKRVWVARHIDLTPISISGSTCEDGEGSVTA